MLKRTMQRVAFTSMLVLCGAEAQAAEMLVLCSNGLKAVLEELQPEFERASGHTLAIQFSSTATIKQRIAGGEAFDVTFLTTDVIDELITSGKLVAATRTELARAGIGVGFRRGATKPDVRTADSLKHALVSARSLAYTRDGASRPHIDRMLNSLGIAAELQPRTRLLGPGQAPESVAKGESDLVITLISEILPVEGVELAGPLPAEYQSYVSFAGAAAVGAGDATAVEMLIKFIDGPGVAVTYEAKGMEPR